MLGGGYYHQLLTSDLILATDSIDLGTSLDHMLLMRFLAFCVDFNCYYFQLNPITDTFILAKRVGIMHNKFSYITWKNV